MSAEVAQTDDGSTDEGSYECGLCGKTGSEGWYRLHYVLKH